MLDRKVVTQVCILRFTCGLSSEKWNDRGGGPSSP
jgi:hypothetical protein